MAVLLVLNWVERKVGEMVGPLVEKLVVNSAESLAI
jgi:hypothetical protein